MLDGLVKVLLALQVWTLRPFFQNWLVARLWLRYQFGEQLPEFCYHWLLTQISFSFLEKTSLFSSWQIKYVDSFWFLCFLSFTKLVVPSESIESINESTLSGLIISDVAFFDLESATKKGLINEEKMLETGACGFMLFLSLLCRNMLSIWVCGRLFRISTRSFCICLNRTTIWSRHFLRTSCLCRLGNRCRKMSIFVV